MDYIAYGTLVAAVIAALAAIWSSIISQRQLNLTKSANSPPLPVINARLSSVDDQPEWAAIFVHITNRADAPVKILTVDIETPKPSRLLSSDKANRPRGPEPKFLNPLPVDQASAETNIGMEVGPIGSIRFGSAGDRSYFTFYAHDPSGKLRKAVRPQVGMKLQWQDHEASVFKMMVTVTG